jgi:hypothetical protein
MVAHDMDGDGRDDLIMIEAKLGEPEGELSVVFFDAEGDVDETVGWRRLPRRVSVGDVDADGLADIVLTGNTQWLEVLPQGFDSEFAGVSVLRNEGGRDFFSILSVDEWNELEDPKGLVELAGWGPAWIDGQTLVQAGEDPVPTISAPALGLTANAAASTGTQYFEDEDRDWLHLAVVIGEPKANEPGTFEPSAQINRYEWVDDEPTTFSVAPVAYPGATHVFPWMSFGDVDGDGVLDLIGQTARAPQLHNTIRVAWGQPDGTFHGDQGGEGVDYELGTALARLDMDAESAILATGDLNADGVPDFVLEGSLAVSGVCSFAGEQDWDCGCSLSDEGFYSCLPLHSVGVSGKWSRAVIADVTDDGRADVIGVLESNPQRLQIIKTGVTPFSFSDAEPEFLEVGIAELAVGELDYDGAPDVIIRTEGLDDGDDEIHVIWGGDDEPAVHQLFGGTELAAGTLTLDGLAIGAQGKGVVGLASFEPAAERLLAWGTEPPAAELSQAWYHDALIGSFSEHGATELALLGTAQDVTILGRTDQAVTARVAASAQSEYVSTLPLDTPWEVYDTPGFEETLPEFAVSAGSSVIADLDGDGRDELIVVTSTTPMISPTGITPAGDGFVGVYAQDGPEWAKRETVEIAGLSLGGEWPYVHRSQPVEVADLDGDGDLDLFAVGRHDNGGQSGVALLNASGRLDEVSRIDSGNSTWQSWSFLGRNSTVAQRVARVTDGVLEVGSFDVGAGTLDVQLSAAAPNGVSFSTTGDFDGDGLTDLALATEKGAVIYRGVAVHE